MIWTCECGEPNRLKNPQCIKCGAAIPRKFLHIIFKEEYEKVTKQLLYEDRQRLLKRVERKQRRYVYLIAPINIVLWMIVTVFLFYNVKQIGWETPQNNMKYAANSINPVHGFGTIGESIIVNTDFMWDNIENVAVGEYKSVTQNGGATGEYGENMLGRFDALGSNVERIKSNVIDIAVFIKDRINKH